MLKVSVCIDVSDLARGTAFYCDALGCSLVEEHTDHNTMSAAGVTIHISAKAAGTHATPAGSPRHYERHWTPVHLDFDVEDIDAAISRVEAGGGSVEGVKRGDWGAAAFCADPFGNGFCLLQIVGRHP